MVASMKALFGSQFVSSSQIVMLDNFEPAQLRRDAKTFKETFPHVVVEVSWGITNETMADIFVNMWTSFHKENWHMGLLV